MTVEIRELIIQAEVTESSPLASPLATAGYTDVDERRWVEKIKQEVLEQLLERGSL